MLVGIPKIARQNTSVQKKSGMKDPIERKIERGPSPMNFSHHILVIIMIPFYKLMLSVNLTIIIEILTLTKSQPTCEGILSMKIETFSFQTLTCVRSDVLCKNS